MISRSVLNILTDRQFTARVVTGLQELHLSNCVLSVEELHLQTSAVCPSDNQLTHTNEYSSPLLAGPSARASLHVMHVALLPQPHVWDTLMYGLFR